VPLGPEAKTIEGGDTLVYGERLGYPTAVGRGERGNKYRRVGARGEKGKKQSQP